MEKKNLAAGVKEMRSVAKKLLAWADDLEKAGKEEASENDVNSAVASVAAPAGHPADGGKPAKTLKGADASVAADAPAASEPLALSRVKAFLTKKCAAGYSGQVKALIASFGASSLSEVPAESLGALVDAAMLLGQEGEDAHAG